MKTCPSILILAACTCLFAAVLPGCKTSDITPDNVTLAASTATTNALAFVKPADQKTVAAETEAAAHAIRTLSTGIAPTVAEFQATIKQFGGPSLSQGYGLLAANLGAVYQVVYPKLVKDGNAQEVTTYLEALSSGVEAGAAPYL